MGDIISDLDSFSSSVPPNRLTTYLRTLAATKRSLPYGQLICVCASHTITTTDALFRLASAVGPHIAVLQVHADIIDDWSEETVLQLKSLASKHRFLIWEGGQILNALVDVVGEDARKTAIDLIRRKYTGGVIKRASWAGIVTAWASGTGFDNQEADILIPTLRAAARETVADTVQTIKTEITAESPESKCIRLVDGQRQDDSAGRICSQHSHNESATENGDAIVSRKTSTISLTHTITQRTEIAEEHPLGYETRQEYQDIGEVDQEHDKLSVDDTVPPPPLLSRSLVLCLPSINDTSFKPEYRRSCIVAAKANKDFVVGFLCNDPWDVTLRRNDILDIQRDNPMEMDQYEHDHCVVTFSPLPNQSPRYRPANVEDSPDTKHDASQNDAANFAIPVKANKFPDFFDSLPARLHSIAAYVLETQESLDRDIGNVGSDFKKAAGPQVMHIPVITLP